MSMRIFRAQMLAFRGTCALAALLDGGRHKHLLRQTLRDARRLERVKLPWAEPLADLIRAQSKLLQRERQTPADGFRRAADGFEATDMAGYAAVARMGWGRLVGGQVGREAVAHANDFFTEQAVRSPRRLIAMLAPVVKRELTS